MSSSITVIPRGTTARPLKAVSVETEVVLMATVLFPFTWLSWLAVTVTVWFWFQLRDVKVRLGGDTLAVPALVDWKVRTTSAI